MSSSDWIEFAASLSSGVFAGCIVGFVVTLAVSWLVLPFIIMSRMDKIRRELVKLNTQFSAANQWLERSDALLELVEKNGRARERAPL